MQSKKFSYYLLCLFLILFPIMEGYANEYGGAGTTLIGFGLASIWLFQTLSTQKIRWDIGCTILLIFSIWMIATSLWSNNQIVSEKLIFSYVMIFSFYIIIYDLARTENQIITLISSYLIGLLLLSLTAISNINSLSSFAGLSNRYSAAGTDPNNFGMMLTSAIPLLFFLNSLLHNKYRLIVFFTCSVIATLVLSTASRASFATLILSLFCIFVQTRNIKSLLISLAFSSMGLIFFIYSFNEIIPSSSYERIISSIDNVADDERLLIWKKIFEDPSLFLIGIGAGLVYETFGLQSHNTFVSSLIEGGIVSALAWISFWALHLYYLASLIKTKKNTRSNSLFLMFSLVILLVAASTLNWEFRKPLFFLMAIYSAWYSLNNKLTQQ